MMLLCSSNHYLQSLDPDFSVYSKRWCKNWLYINYYISVSILSVIKHQGWSIVTYEVNSSLHLIDQIQFLEFLLKVINYKCWTLNVLEAAI